MKTQNTQERATEIDRLFQILGPLIAALRPAYPDTGAPKTFEHYTEEERVAVYDALSSELHRRSQSTLALSSTPDLEDLMRRISIEHKYLVARIQAEKLATNSEVTYALLCEDIRAYRQSSPPRPIPQSLARLTLKVAADTKEEKSVDPAVLDACGFTKEELTKQRTVINLARLTVEAGFNAFELRRGGC